MTKRRRNNKRKTSDIRAILILVAMGAVICSLAYSRCESYFDSYSSSCPTEEDFELKELLQVKMPETMKGIALKYPGFDVMFSNEHKQPYFTAWALTPEHAIDKTVPRSNKFRPDPEVPMCALLSDYKNSGYDRGHMAPSADFRYSKEAQDATFFLTNICPQAKALNERAWAKLEEQCRTWATRDSTLVIISGPILSDKLTTTIGESKVTVPNRFFKVILAPYANPPRAIGFVMPNGYVEGGVQASVMTVDQVEDITGYDFFSSLPDEIEAAVESEARYHVWQNPPKRR